MKSIHVSISQNMVEQLDHYKESTGLTRSETIRDAIKAYLQASQGMQPGRGAVEK
jgi:metal-responsive CopG/Arc/MetJ family transcriptional regulator